MKKTKKKLTWYKKKAWEECSRFIRLLYSKDGICTCYTCGIKKPIKQMQAGHGFAGRNNSILFEVDIIRPQGYGCNICCAGKLDIFTYKLRKELGDERYEELWAKRNKIVKYTQEDFEEIRANFQLRCANLLADTK